MAQKHTRALKLISAGILLVLFSCLLIVALQDRGQGRETPASNVEAGSVSKGDGDAEAAKSKPESNVELRSGREIAHLSGSAEPSPVSSPLNQENPAERLTPLTPIVSVTPAGYPSEVFYRPAELSDEQIAEAVAIIVGRDHASSRERFVALARLRGKPLPDSATTALLDYLNQTDRHRAMSEQAMYVFINDLVAVFHDNPILDDRYLRTSFEVINNSQEAEVIRDYVLQGLSRAYPNATDDQAEFIKQVAWHGLEYQATSLTGTALLALNRIHAAGEFSDVESERLNEVVVSVVSAPDVDERTRITAIQVAAELNLSELVTTLADLAFPEAAKPSEIYHQGNLTPSEMLAALSALDSLGYPEIDQLYQHAAQSEHPLLAQAAARILTQSESSP